MDYENILRHGIVGIVGTENSGKTNLLWSMIEHCKRYDTDIWCYFYHTEYKRRADKNIKLIRNLEDLESIRESFIFLDEFAELFGNGDNRHGNRRIERTLNLLHQNGNVIVFCGVPRYYRDLIASRVHKWLIKSIKFKNIVQRSALDQYVKSLSGDFMGSTQINMRPDEVLLDGRIETVPYLHYYDKKRENKDLFKLRKDVKSSL